MASARYVPVKRKTNRERTGQSIHSLEDLRFGEHLPLSERRRHQDRPNTDALSACRLQECQGVVLPNRKTLKTFGLARGDGLDACMQSVEMTQRMKQWPLLQQTGCVKNTKRDGEDGLVMATEKMNKCAHIPCLCDVPAGEEYCGPACRDAGGNDVEIACQCDHPTCPLTSRWFAPRRVDLAF